MSNLITPKGLKIKLPQTIAGSFKSNTIIEGIKITHVGSPSSTVFMKCVLLKTNDELLIYQKRLFSKKCSLRFHIKFTAENEGVNLNMRKVFLKVIFLLLSTQLILNVSKKMKIIIIHCLCPKQVG